MCESKNSDMSFSKWFFWISCSRIGIYRRSWNLSSKLETVENVRTKNHKGACNNKKLRAFVWGTIAHRKLAGLNRRSLKFYEPYKWTTPIVVIHQWMRIHNLVFVPKWSRLLEVSWGHPGKSFDDAAGTLIVGHQGGWQVRFLGPTKARNPFSTPE